MWLAVSLTGYAILAIVSVLDKYILTKEKVKPSLFVFYSAFPVLVVFMLLPFVGRTYLNSIQDFFLAAISGLTFVLGLWTMYRGFLKSEVSHIAPLIGGLVPPVILILGQRFLDEILFSNQILALWLLTIGTLLVAFEYKDNKYKIGIGVFYGVLSAMLFAVSHVSAKFLYDSYDFITGFIWTRGMIGVFGTILLAYGPLRRAIFHGKNDTKLIEQKKSNKNSWVILDKILAVVGVVLVQYGISLGSVTVVSALAGIQFAILIVLVYLLSKFLPRKFREEYGRFELAQEVVAIVLIVAGLVMMV